MPDALNRFSRIPIYQKSHDWKVQKFEENYESITIYQDSNDDDKFTSADLSNITAQVQNHSGVSVSLSPDNANNFKTIDLSLSK